MCFSSLARKTSDMWNEEVTSQIKMKFGDGLGESNINTYVGYIKFCVENIRLLSIFHLKRGSSAIDFTRPILNAALLKGIRVTR